MKALGLRDDDAPPRSYEILIRLVLWSFLFELVLPYTRLFEGLATGDHADIFFYTLGAVAAAVFWRAWYGVPANGRAEADSRTEDASDRGQ